MIGSDNDVDIIVPLNLQQISGMKMMDYKALRRELLMHLLLVQGRPGLWT